MVNIVVEGGAWRLVRVPVTMTRLGNSDVRLRIGISGPQAVNGAPVEIYGARLYIASHPVSAGNLRTRGPSSGGWNGQHIVMGAYHLWIDSSGRLRIKSGAPTSDTDGTVVGTQS